ncbi:hypothetical protein COV61_01220 [Candidatus Micrarchaeota archaeon CG11_big_fil_rev_8_21_14_0_20_47_5]|nr:MAG: hypothetical protein AUJ17_03950 [Candidatus Micrarchaeota archaeon CG1_02_47_40]PIN84098.1 MAG: hypothetical protein COV61_01220 [Candidatus Micrarchaeota archaeon CG11_big_fil_rev_8_21_14_0_20_47_5]
MAQNFDWKTFKLFLKKVIVFKSKTSFIYINADGWEEAIFFALKKMGENPEWRLGSHEKGADVKISKFAISAKAGKIENGHLTLSSYRLTRYKNIAEMTKFINGEINYDFYLCCARIRLGDGGRKYSVFRVPSSVFKPRAEGWKKYQNKNGDEAGWQYIQTNGVNARIVRKMSNQLWMDIPLKLCEELFSVSFSKNELGSDLEQIFE